MFKHLCFASTLFMFSIKAWAAPAAPNDCWSGVMAPDKAAHGQIVATGPVMRWRIGTPLVVYPTKEDYAQLDALMSKGETGTFDTSRPITIIPTWISGPEPGDKTNKDEEHNIEVTLQYRTAQGEIGTLLMTYWTPMSGKQTSLPPDQQATITKFDWSLHDMGCRGIP